MLNKITLQGRIVRNPELRYTSNNTATATITLAVERDYAQNGQRTADFIDCVTWRQTAEFVDKYFHKGDMMLVSGSLQMRDWTDRDGNKRRTAEVLVDHVYFCGSKRENGAAPAKRDERENDGDTFADITDDDDSALPF